MIEKKLSLTEINPVSGISLGTSNARIKPTEEDDVLIIEMAEDATCAGVFTKNAFSAAPVQIAKAHLPQNPRWLLVNSGNANAGTGRQGMEDALACCSALASKVNGKSQQVLPFSTGVIGENLPVDKIKAVLSAAMNNAQENHWNKAALAIMTTDTFPKSASMVIELAGHPVTITGIAKGSGMIHPNMATLLSFIGSDATIDQGLLQHCLFEAVEQSFNRITVDGDTSTNDACILIASGCSTAAEIIPDSENYKLFAKAVNNLCKQLAELIIKDGEGATKLMRISVEQAVNKAEALLVAKTVAHSPLVKTAFFASDPNWGRILAAVGRCEIEKLALDQVAIYLDDVCIVEKGGRAESYTEAQGQAVMDQDDIVIRVILGRGDAKEEVLTCDLSYDYVRINAEYRT